MRELKYSVLDTEDEIIFMLETDSFFEKEFEYEFNENNLLFISNDEIVTIITPIDNKENKLDIHFFGDSNERFKQTQLQNIFTRLKDAGLQYSSPKCAEGTEYNSTGNEKVRNFDLIKQQKGLLQ